MKKSTLLATLAVVAMASCTEEQYVGDPHSQNGAVTFASNFSAMTRGENKVGAEAATALGNKFVVYGTKHTSAEDATATNDQLVFNNYQVAWTANTAGTTTSNTHNWEYVGLKAYAAAPAVTTDQTIKYWDYGAANGYTFYAFSSKDISYPANTNDKVSVSKTTTVSGENATVYDKGYTVTIKQGASLENLYFSDREPVAKTGYGKPVTLKFRNLTAKVRAGFYETIPGYSVKITKMYSDNDASEVVTSFAAMEDANETNFVAALQNVSRTLTDAGSQFTITYDATGGVNQNKVKVTSNETNKLYTLTLGTNIQSATSLGTASNAPTWDTAAGDYTTVFPFEANANPMLLKVDYTLTSTDGSGETITVTGARVAVPTQYVQWKPNYSYTYLFKISDNTNGTTGGSNDPEGLYPITFDAVVIAATDEQETITEISTNSFTTYTEGKVVTSNDEYVAGNDIYAVLNKVTAAGENTLIAPTDIGTAAKEVQVYTVTDVAPEATVTEATVKAQLIGANTNMTLTALTGNTVPTLVYQVPAADGTNYTFGTESQSAAVKIPSVAAGTTYAIVYCTTAYVAPTYAAVVDDAAFSSGTTYYFKSTNNGKNVYYPVSGINADNFGTYKDKGSLFTQTATGTSGVYDVKVIKVNASVTPPEPEAPADDE